MVEAINWNRIEDETDKIVWDRVNANNWIDTKVPLSDDRQSWNSLSDREKDVTRKVFGGLTFLDTIQSMDGVLHLIPDSRTPQEAATYTQFAYMESIHAKSYSSIFSTLCNSKEIDEIFEWVGNNKYLRHKAEVIGKHYHGSCPLMRKAASVALESLLFYSGFYMPMYWVSRAKLTNTNTIIKLIIRDEAIHGYYIGYKFQMGYNELSDYEKQLMTNKVLDMFEELYNNELGYIHELYDDLGLAEDVKKFLHYNYNKALQNLGYDAMWNKEETAVNPAILAALAPGENHDFFSDTGAVYVVAKVEQTTDDDWEVSDDWNF